MTDLDVEQGLVSPVQGTYPCSTCVKTIVLEKVAGADTKLHPQGDVFRWTYKSYTHDQALHRASEILKRQGEDRVNWKEVR